MEKAKPKRDKAAEKAKKELRREYVKQFYVNNKAMYVVTLIAMFMIAAVSLAISWLMQEIIDCATGNDVAPLIRILIISGIIFVIFLLSYLVLRFAQPRFMRRAMSRYKQYAFEKITRKSISSFSGESTSKYISALTNDVTSVETNYLMPVFEMVQHIVGFVGALALMLYYSPLLTAVAIGLSIIPVIASILTGSRLAKEEAAVSERNEGFVGTVKDLLSGFSVIKSFKAELEAVKLFCRENDGVEDAKKKRRSTSYTINMLGSATSIIAQMGVFLVGAYLAITGDAVTPGIVIVFVQLMNFVLTPISQLPPIFANRKAAEGLIDKLAESVNANVRRTGRDVDNKLDDGIDISNLTFGFEESNPVLRGLSLRFDTGKSYAIVGGSGSGKSTLLNLLMGSYDNYGGEIRYDGDEVREISSDSLYELISLVQQNVFIFNDTIRNNVTMFRSFDDEKVSQAMRRSGLSSLIAARGEDYICGENGSGLSGGEKQRISIARALLQETPVMLIDEATAALDAETAFEVTNAILDVEGLTRIVVTHRLEESLLARYDEILVMRNGTISERGSFKELMDARALFYSLFTVSQ